MLEPHELTEHLTTLFNKHYANWALGRREGLGPISLRPPSTAQRKSDPVACMSWANRWRAYEGPGTITWQRKQFPTGLVELPMRVSLTGPIDAAGATTSTTAAWRRCGERMIALQEAFPTAVFTKPVIRQITDLTDDDYQRLTTTAQWLRANPHSGLLPRQLPVEGVDTKWLEAHLNLVSAVTGMASIPADSAERTTSALAQLGLRELPKLIPVHVLDPDLRAMLGGMRHLQAPVDDLNAWPKAPSTVLITENKQTAYALDGENLPHTVVVHAMGLHIALYPQVQWIQNADRVVYWGDLDTYGLEFLDNLRRLGVNARSILTDTATFTRFQHLAVTGATPRTQSVSHLHNHERELYDLLADHHAQSGEGIMLEQERIPWDHARTAIRLALDHTS